MSRRALWVVGLVAALAPHAWAEPPIKSYVDPPQGARCSYNHFPEVIYTGDHSYATIYTRQVHEKIDCIGRTDACEDGSDQCRCHDERRTDADIAGATMGTLKTLLAVAACAAMIGETGPVAVGLCFAISGIEGAQAGRQLTEVYAAATDGCDDPGDPGTEIGPIPLEGARAKLELWQVFDEVRSVGVSATCECYIDRGFWAAARSWRGAGPPTTATPSRRSTSPATAPRTVARTSMAGSAPTPGAGWRPSGARASRRARPWAPARRFLRHPRRRPRARPEPGVRVLQAHLVRGGLSAVDLPEPGPDLRLAGDRRPRSGVPGRSPVWRRPARRWLR
jgi:hypothetical protein